MVQRIAYVTGGMGGIGTSICQRLAKEGHVVIAGCGPSRDYNKWLNEQKEAGYDQLKSWVDEHQRPHTEAENEELVREKLAELRGEGSDD